MVDARFLATIGRTVLAAAALGLVFMPSLAGLPAQADVVQGSIYPVGPVFAEGRLFVPASQPTVATWSLPTDEDPAVWSLARVSAYVDEWRWTSTSPAEASGNVRAPPTSVRTHAEHTQTNATLHILRAGEHNRWFFTALQGGAPITLAQMTDCDFYAGVPRLQPIRSATRDVSAPSLSNLPHVAINRPSTLHLDCRSSALEIVVPPRYELAAFDTDLFLAGSDPLTQQDTGLLLRPGAFAQPNATMPGLYDNLLRHVSLRPHALDPFTIQVGRAERTSVESPILQLEGTLHLPPFVGELRLGERLVTATDRLTRLDGDFLVVAGGHRNETTGMEIGGSSRLAAQAPDVRPQGPSLAILSTAAIAGLALAALLGWKSKALVLGGLGLFTRLTPVRALEHEMRKTIHDYVHANPGVRMHVAFKALGINRATFKHHAKTLAAQGLLVLHRDGRKINLFPKRAGVDHQTLSLVQDPFVQRLLAALAEPQVWTQNDLAKRLQVSQAYVSKVLDRLERGGVIVRRRLPRGSHYDVQIANASATAASSAAADPA